MSSTITSWVATGVTFGAGTYTSPLTITSAGTVTNSAGDAVYAAGTYANPTVLNQGTVKGATGAFDVSGGIGVDFKDGGTIANGDVGHTTALIAGGVGGYGKGGGAGISLLGGGGIANYGTIAGGAGG